MSVTDQEARRFPLLVALSAATGILMVDSFSAVHECIEFVAGEPVFTHQIPRVGDEVAASCLAQHPQLAPAYAEAEQINRGNYAAFAQKWLDEYGPELRLRPMTEDEHERRDFMSEALEHFKPEDIITSAQFKARKP